MEDIFARLKAIRIPFTLEEENGWYYAHMIDYPKVPARGKTVEAALYDLIDSLRKSLAVFTHNLTPLSWVLAGNDNLLLLFMKVLVCTDDELLAAFVLTAP